MCVCVCVRGCFGIEKKENSNVKGVPFLEVAVLPIFFSATSFLLILDTTMIIFICCALGARLAMIFTTRTSPP